MSLSSRCGRQERPNATGSTSPATEPSRAADNIPMHRFPHPISVPCPPTAEEEYLQWILSLLCAQAETLAEIKAMLQNGNNL